MFVEMRGLIQVLSCAKMMQSQGTFMSGDVVEEGRGGEYMGF